MALELTDEELTYVVVLSLLAEGGRDTPIGPFERDQTKVGLLVGIDGVRVSAYFIFGKTPIPLGGSGVATVVMGVPQPLLRLGDTLDVLEGTRLVGTAVVKGIVDDA